MTSSQQSNRLKEIITEKSYITGGDFKLASGQASNFFFDMKPTLLDPEGAALTADIILNYLKGETVDAIGGLEIGACPIASAVCTRSHGTATPIRAFYVRKTPKKRGTQKLIEGAELKPGERVVIVEDVTTSGGSALDAVARVRNECGCDIIKVITIIDREQGAAEAFASAGIPFHALFKKSEFE